jgi:hypothetical protein
VISPDLPSVLYHYTCNHGLNGIIADRALKPNYQPWLGMALTWLTDLDTPDRAALGLTSDHIVCDRTENRVDVTPTADMQPWTTWARNARVPQVVRDMLEGGGGFPRHWWVCPVLVPVQTFHRARGYLPAASA